MKDTTILIIIILCLLITSILIIEFYCFLNKKTFNEITNPGLYNRIELKQVEFEPKKTKKYLKSLNQGYYVMKNTRIVIGGLFKDSADKFILFKKRINNLSRYFKDLQVVIFENDSSDNSRILLLNWEKNQSNIHIIKLPDNEFCLLKKRSAVKYGQFSDKRMRLMSEYRNYIKNYVDMYYSDFDYFAMIDTDTVGPLSINGLAHSFSTQEQLNWDMIASNGRIGLFGTLGSYKYYDALALYNYDKNFQDNSIIISKIILKLDSVNNNPIKVDYAFGGLAIYKMSSIKNVNYTPADGKYICEHSIFLNNMKLNGYSNFYIDPKLIFLVGKQGPDIFGTF
jgi:hypothetical protein